MSRVLEKGERKVQILKNNKFKRHPQTKLKKHNILHTQNYYHFFVVVNPTLSDKNAVEIMGKYD